MDLRNDLVASKPIDFDFSTPMRDFKEHGRWTLVYPSRDTDLDTIIDWMHDEDFLEELNWTWDNERKMWLWKCDCTDSVSWHPWTQDCPLEVNSWEDIESALRDAFCDATTESSNSWYPMMNYALPAPDDDPEEMQGKLIGSGPLVVVEIDDENYLALTSGGMDFSWEICAAYVALGYRPPAHYCDLPRMAGRGKSDSDRALMNICVQSLEMLSMWNSASASRLIERIHGGE